MIEKCAAIILRQRRLLVVRKRRSSVFISPGGKINAGEAPLDCLRRELWEELNVKLIRAEIFSTHEQPAAGEDFMIRIHSWIASISGVCTPSSEIEELRWIRRSDPIAVGSVFAQCVMPELVRAGLLDD